MSVTATIVLVDAKPERREKLAAALKRDQLSLQCVSSAEEAVAATRRSPPNLFLHACDNITVLPSIRRLKMNMPNSPLVAYTESFREITRLRSMEIGADEMVQIEMLAQEIEAFLPAALVAEKPGQPQEGSSAKTVPEQKGQMYLQLNSGEISNALQFLCMASRHGQLVLTFGDETKGVLFMKGGTITHAEYKNRKGMEAVAIMLMQGETEALFMEGKEPEEQTIQQPISQILLEASVLADELGAQGVK